MEQYVKRMLDEEEALKGKIKRLSQFINDTSSQSKLYYFASKSTIAEFYHFIPKFPLYSVYKNLLFPNESGKSILYRRFFTLRTNPGNYNFSRSCDKMYSYW